jgi:hypothetical protein
MTVYVLYSDYGSYEGCSPPQSITTKEDDAEAWVKKNVEVNTYSEFEVDEPTNR